MDKEQSRGLRTAIRKSLMAHWDPIGVSDVPEAADEYDGYISEICELLKSGASDKKIADHLRTIETEQMGLTDGCGNPLVSAEQRATAVSDLQRIYEPFATKSKVSRKRGFKHWTLFTKHISPAFAKTQARRKKGLCIGCGLKPCECKNPKSPRGTV